MNKLLRIAFEAAGAALAGVVANEAKKQVEKHGPELLEKLPDAAQKAKDGVANAAAKVKNFKFKK